MIMKTCYTVYMTWKNASDSKKLKEVCEELCIRENDEFIKLYCHIEDEVIAIKQVGGKKTLFQLIQN